MNALQLYLRSMGRISYQARKQFGKALIDCVQESRDWSCCGSKSTIDLYRDYFARLT